MNISIIVAVTANNAIGVGGDMLFHIADDLRRFKAITMGHPVVMGRKTFESLPGGPLPGRRNIVISRTMASPADDSYAVARSLPKALDIASVSPGGDEIFIIGGGEIYRQALPLARTIYLTRIDAHTPEADTFFPEIPAEWKSVETSQVLTTSRGTRYQFITLKKVN